MSRAHLCRGPGHHLRLRGRLPLGRTLEARGCGPGLGVGRDGHASASIFTKPGFHWTGGRGPAAPVAHNEGIPVSEDEQQPCTTCIPDEHGELTAGEAAAQAREYRGSSVRVNPRFSDETQLPVVVAWLKSQGVPDSALTVGVSSFLGYVPVPLLGELSRKPGVLEARPVRRRAAGGTGPQSSSQQQPPPARPVPVTSQGVAAHQAGRWPSAYDGTGVRVGIIDVGFDHFADLMRGRGASARRESEAEMLRFGHK